MSSKGTKLRFQQKKGREILSREEAEYWLQFLPKVLKVGTEFEINLPSPKNTLEIDLQTPCIHHKRGCSSDCANLETCLVERHPVFCQTRHHKIFMGKPFTCPAENDSDTSACNSCEGWQLNCRGLDCAMHTPLCTVCPSFKREGNVVEQGDIRRDAESVRNEMRELLQPTQFVGKVGKYGVLEVTKDNSLINNGGIEVPTVGRRLHWKSFHNMCSDIINPIVERGGFVNERCGQHFHILAGYLLESRSSTSVSELEKPLPEIVLANLHQLHRRYELAMFWIMSAGTSINNLTRWARFRQSIRRFSAISSRMSKIKDEMAEVIVGMNTSSSQRGKYASVAYHLCQFDEEGDVSTFHIENRIADGALSPAVVSAWAMLCYALVLKAVRFSQYGVMEIGTLEYKEAIKNIQPYLIDGEHREWGEARLARTINLKPHIPWLRENTKELINWLKPELSGLGPAYEILLSLADEPCSIRLIKGQSWKEIERDLYNPHLITDTSEEAFPIEEIREVVDLSTISECETLEIWIEEVAAYLGKEPGHITETITHMVDSGEFRWSTPIGTLINI